MSLVAVGLGAVVKASLAGAPAVMVMVAPEAKDPLVVGVKDPLVAFSG